MVKYKKHHHFILKIYIIASFAIFLFLPKISFAANQAVINEIMANPAGDDTGQEWIELYNPTSDSVDLTGWQLNAASGKYYTLPTFTLASKSFVVIHWRTEGTDTASELFTGSQSVSENMGNKSGFVALFKNSSHTKDTIVDYSEYGEAAKTWESTAMAAGIWQTGQFITSPEEGQSIGMKQDGQDQNLVSDWQIFSQPTPGQPNASPAAPLSPSPLQNQNENSSQSSSQSQTATSTPAYKNYSTQIFINEFMPYPQNGKEWVELVNLDIETIDLTGWQIDDGPEQSAPQIIPSQTLIEPNQLLVIELNKDILNNDGDQVRLIWPDNQILHSVSYKKSLMNYSSARFENGLWLWTDKPTPGQKNEKPAPATTPVSIEKNEQVSQPKIDILAGQLSENVSEIKNQNQVSQKEIKISTSQNASPVSLTADQAAHNIKPAAIGSIDQKQTLPAESSSEKIYFILGGIILLAFLSGMGLVYFKRRLTPKKSNDNI